MCDRPNIILLWSVYPSKSTPKTLPLYSLSLPWAKRQITKKKPVRHCIHTPTRLHRFQKILKRLHSTAQTWHCNLAVSFSQERLELNPPKALQNWIFEAYLIKMEAPFDGGRVVSAQVGCIYTQHSLIRRQLLRLFIMESHSIVCILLLTFSYFKFYNY